MKARAMQVMSVFDINIPSSVTAAAALDQATPPEVRLQSLRLLARQHPDAPERRPVLTELLGDKSQPDLRIESVRQLLALDPAAGIAAAAGLITGGRLAEQQAAIAQLADGPGWRWAAGLVTLFALLLALTGLGPQAGAQILVSNTGAGPITFNAAPALAATGGLALSGFTRAEWTARQLPWPEYVHVDDRARVAAAVERFGRLDFAHNNAGIVQRSAGNEPGARHDDQLLPEVGCQRRREDRSGEGAAGAHAAASDFAAG